MNTPARSGFLLRRRQATYRAAPITVTYERKVHGPEGNCAMRKTRLWDRPKSQIRSVEQMGLDTTAKVETTDCMDWQNRVYVSDRWASIIALEWRPYENNDWNLERLDTSLPPFHSACTAKSYNSPWRGLRKQCMPSLWQWRVGVCCRVCWTALQTTVAVEHRCFSFSHLPLRISHHVSFR